MKTILVTGAAGFIGYHLSTSLCEQGYDVIGIDSINDYYDVGLKQGRLSKLKGFTNFEFHHIDISDKTAFDAVFEANNIDVVVHLAAQAGVRYSINHPYKYIDSNIYGFMNVLEACRHKKIEHLIYASSSSVYGMSDRMPLSTSDKTDNPVSLYAATKKANEVMAHSYAALYKIPCTGLRFFTVYGPWGRPDMAYYLFTDSIVKNKPIRLFNDGNLKRDFTYIDDIVSGINNLIKNSPHSDTDIVPNKLFNIGNHKPVHLMEFVSTLEELLDKKAIIENVPMQPGDVYETYAKIDDLEKETGFLPHTDIKSGLGFFIDWYKQYYKL